VTRDENGKKNIIKYSIKDSQNSFITFHNTITASEAYINNLKDKHLPIQPFIVIIGVPLKPEQIYLFFDSIKYKFFCIVRAIDVCFKIIHLFNLQYPLQSSAVWMFIQKLFYNISTKYDTSHPIITQIIHELKK